MANTNNGDLSNSLHTNDRNTENHLPLCPFNSNPPTEGTFAERLKEVNDLNPGLLQDLANLSIIRNLPQNSEPSTDTELLDSSSKNSPRSLVNSLRLVMRNNRSTFNTRHENPRRFLRNEEQGCHVPEFSRSRTRIVGYGNNKLYPLHPLRFIDLIRNATPRTHESGCVLRYFNSNLTGLSSRINSRRLLSAVQTNNTLEVKTILESGITPGSTIGYPLHLACRSGYAEIVELLLKHGLDPNGRDIFNRTPLHSAVNSMKGSIVTLLLQAGADVSCIDGTGSTPLYIAQLILNFKKMYSLSDVETTEVEEMISILQAHSQKQEESKNLMEDLSSVYSHLSLSNTVS